MRTNGFGEGPERRVAWKDEVFVPLRVEEGGAGGQAMPGEWKRVLIMDRKTITFWGWCHVETGRFGKVGVFLDVTGVESDWGCCKCLKEVLKA
jgi:hypothetical protein